MAWWLVKAQGATYIYFTHTHTHIYEGRLQSSWTHFITPGRNFVEVR